MWVSPKLIDFKRKIEVRVNGRSYKGAPRYDLSPLLEDLRLTLHVSQNLHADLFLFDTGHSRDGGAHALPHNAQCGRGEAG